MDVALRYITARFFPQTTDRVVRWTVDRYVQRTGASPALEWGWWNSLRNNHCPQSRRVENRALSRLGRYGHPPMWWRSAAYSRWHQRWNRPLHRFFRVLCASASRCNPPSEGKILFVQFFYAKVNNRVDRFALVHNHAMHFVIERFVRENFEAEGCFF